MDSSDIVLITVLYQHLYDGLNELRMFLPPGFEQRYNSLRAVEQWLCEFRRQFDLFITKPF